MASQNKVKTKVPYTALRFCPVTSLTSQTQQLSVPKRHYVISQPQSWELQFSLLTVLFPVMVAFLSVPKNHPFSQSSSCYPILNHGISYSQYFLSPPLYFFFSNAYHKVRYDLVSLFIFIVCLSTLEHKSLLGRNLCSLLYPNCQ